MASFDLIGEPWLPVDGPDGLHVVGLAELFRVVDRCSLAITDPLELVAVMRQVILPIVIDALGHPSSEAEWERRFQAGRLDADAIVEYLARHRDRFDLFHPETPFGQVAQLEASSGETRTSSLLVAAEATGNNVPLFSSHTEADPPALTPARAALAVLAVQCWDTAGLKTGARGDSQARRGKTTGNQTGSVGQLGVVLPWGGDLFTTILLNLPIAAGPRPADDLPPWRRPASGPSWQTRVAYGLVDQLTWQSRRIRLVRDPADGLVRRAVVTAGDRLSFVASNIEPHTIWRRPEKPRPGDPPLRPRRHAPGQALWRGLPGLLAVKTASVHGEEGPYETSALVQQLANLSVQTLPADFPLQVVSVGVEYGNQSAVIENVMSDSLPLPLTALAADPTVRGLLLDVARMADELRRAHNQLAADLARAAGASEVARYPGEDLMALLDPPTRRLFAGIQMAPDLAEDGVDAWRERARHVAGGAAEPLVRGSGPETFLGHRRPGPEHWDRASLAELRYRRQLNQILGSRADFETSEVADGRA